ncbi:MAG: DUF2203 domain-containing protein [Planctomycetes bacterium]|nr:DUF2203 domain-containing protein [Planctomycetota bacterium]
MDAFEAISLPESSAVGKRRQFSVAEANRSLPLVRRIVADIVREYGRLRELDRLCRHHDAGGDPARAEDLRRQYASLTDRLSALREELEEIGCELKDYAAGLVDFPARIDDHDLLLCWMLGEEKVSHWHEVGAGFAGRQPVTGEWE